MKKIIATFMVLAMFAGIFAFAAPTQVQAQRGAWYQKYRDSRGRTRYARVEKPGVYRRHRNVINMGIGTGAGALLGGLIGGKKGALIGAGTGAAGSAVYTYGINKKKRKYVKVKRY